MFNVSILLLDNERLQAGDTIDQWRDQWNTATVCPISDISQGSTATHLRCGEIFSDSII